MLNILFKAVKETLMTFGENEMGGRLGFMAILHTWDQLLKSHFHLHCLIPGGVLTKDGTSWIPCKNDYLFNVEALGLVFRGKFIFHMSRAYNDGQLTFPKASFGKEAFRKLKKRLYANKWVVDIRESTQYPEQVIEYLGRYTHRVAISNSRIRSVKNGHVTFGYKNRETNEKKETTIDAVEFIKRFLRHALPKRFVRIRHYGFLSNRYKTRNLSRVRQLIGISVSKKPRKDKSVKEMMKTLTGVDITLCPCCQKGRMHLVMELERYKAANAANIIRPPNLSKSRAAIA